MSLEPARTLLAEGLKEAAALSHPVVAERHRVAWAYRRSAVDPAAVVAEVDALTQDVEARLELLTTACRDFVRRGEALPAEVLEKAFSLARRLDVAGHLRAVNELSEIVVALFEVQPDAARALAEALVAETGKIVARDDEEGRNAALASALVGEALLLIGDARGRELLRQTEDRCAELDGAAPLYVFLASTLADKEPEHALALSEQVEDSGLRLDLRLQMAGAMPPALHERLFDGAQADALQVAHFRGPEPLVRLGQVMAEYAPERARGLFQQALDDSRDGGSQMQGLQWTGVASALAKMDREWAGQIFREAVAAVEQDEDRARRAAALVLIANEMAGSHPREAAEVFARAMNLATEFDAVWEFAHILDLVFRSDRSPYLDPGPAAPVIRLVLSRLSDDDPRIPGVLGLPEVSRWMEQVDPAGAADVVRRWLSVAEASNDTDGMTQAALALHHWNPAEGVAALRRVYELLVRRIDCPSMGEFSRSAAALAPELVLELAPYIPDRRERGDAQAAAARGLYPQDPERALALVRELERPADRSLALLSLCDNLLGTGDRYQPQPLMEDLP